jgi:uncharacterized membrane protein required for colicin V production
MHNLTHSLAQRHYSFDYVDVIIVAWLIVGILRGRKNGMSQELLPTLKWIAIVVIAGFYYGFLSKLIRKNLGLDALDSNVMSYVVMALVIHMIFSALKTAFGEKLVAENWFGRCEYYFGMVSGCIRFGCMVLVFMALVHAHIISKEKLEEVRKSQKAWAEDVSFPTWGSLQQSILFESFCGPLVQEHLSRVLIASVNTGPSSKSSDTPARVKQNEIDNILGPSKK